VKTEISTDRTAAVELLREGEIVALPTETVYGLAADALNPIAVAKIFEAIRLPSQKSSKRKNVPVSIR